MTWLAAVFHLAVKDVRHELRTREAIASMIVFSLIVIVLFHFAFAEQGAAASVFAPGALWVTFTFSAMIGLARTFSIEELNGCLRGLLLCPHDRSVIFAGKMLASSVVVSAAGTLTLVLFVILFNLPVVPRLWLLWIVMVVGVAGVAAVGTVFSAMTLGTRMRQTILPVLVLPIILPQVVFGMTTTARIIGATGGSIIGGVLSMVSFTVILTTVCMLVFEHVLIE